MRDLNFILLKMVQAVTGNRRRLVLHFDINNTIVMKDLAKGLGTVENVSPILPHLSQTILLTGSANSLQICMG